ncbi:MAG: sel1 repeat family protein [Proteobacteria bacterium]|nr:sel1 repeat family protein [Pseudomonadota bacterium]
MKRPRHLKSLCTALLMFAATGASAHAGSAPSPDDQTDKVLTAMNAASTWGHPDLFGEFAGMRRYAGHDYAGALKYFKYGARYADKLSQLSIGLMYENGEGVARDPATACAWMALASERKYPSFVATRDGVCKALTPAQHDQAVAVLDQLMPEYGDAVAKKRMASALRQALTEGTGSRLGFDSGVSQASANANCGGPAISEGGVNVPRAGCGDPHFYDPSRWDPKQYFAARDAQWHGTVTVGNMQEIGKAAGAAAANPPAPATSGHAANTHP